MYVANQPLLPQVVGSATVTVTVDQLQQIERDARRLGRVQAFNEAAELVMSHGLPETSRTVQWLFDAADGERSGS
jgi:hypothetical protein